MAGIICINKPQGFTSFDVVAKLRGILKMRRIGHAGTLDPMAEGVLPVFIGNATKACDMLPDHDKIYRAGFRLGQVTDTQDSTGRVLAESDHSDVDREKLEGVLPMFRGNIMQVPPMYSAVSVNGQRLYELARRGIEVERKPRPITVYSLEIISFDEESGEGYLEISCSKGTYIRTLINDIGAELRCGAIMTSLVRTSACGFTLDDCHSFEEIETAVKTGRGFSDFVIPIEKVFGYLPKVMLNERQTEMYRNGVRMDASRLSCPASEGEQAAVYGFGGEFLGIGVVTEGLLRVLKNF